VADRLEQQRDRLEDIQEALVSNNRLGQLAAVEAAVVRLQTLADEIRTASYGYAGWFDQSAVDDDELAALYEYDLSLSQGVEWVESNRQRLVETAKSGDQAAFDAAAADLAVTIDRLASRVVQRREVVAEAKRPPAISPRQLFKTVQKALQPEQVLPVLRPGDALSQGGVDYLVVGTVDYRHDGAGWHAYMLQNGEERWLWATDGGRQAFLATPVPAPEDMDGKTAVDWEGETLSVAESGSALADMEGPTGRNTGVAVEFWRLTGPSGRVLWLERWGEEMSAFLGEPVNLEEIEVWQQRQGK
jgi:hypothetical protein